MAQSINRLGTTSSSGMFNDGTQDGWLAPKNQTCIQMLVDGDFVTTGVTEEALLVLGGFKLPAIPNP